MICPCKDCAERYTACHDYCDKYKTWKQPMIDSYEERKTTALNRDPGEGYSQAIRRQVLHNKRNRRR